MIISSNLKCVFYSGPGVLSTSRSAPYSLAFRMDTTDIVYGAYAVDNIAITSCDYPSSTASLNNSLLSFFCDFDNGTICQMDNGNRFSTPTYNFTLVTGETVPSRKLGPTRDRTTIILHPEVFSTGISPYHTCQLTWVS